MTEYCMINEHKTEFSHDIESIESGGNFGDCAQDRILARIESIESGGNFGDCAPIRGSGGVFELRFHFGPGYRIYFGEVDNTIVLLLCGGDKSSQSQDIVRAKNYWREYKETQR